ncbi:MAG TPA: DUF3108 domain-containing protein [Caulobacterales bacterium]|nr:DUF3108 domain-containing protein [Caulobacterales bacterium]
MMRKKILALAAAFAAMVAPGANAATFDAQHDASIFNVVQLGVLGLKGKVTASSYSASATMQTAGVANLFGDNRISAASAGPVAPAGLSWTTFSLDHAYGKKHRQTALARGGAGLSEKVTPPLSNTTANVPVTAAQKAGARDPVNAILEMSRTVGRGACSGTYPVFDGKTYYTLALVPKGKAPYAMGGYNGEATVCTLRYNPIAGMKPTTAAERAKIPQGEAYFSAPVDGFALLISLQVPTPVGLGRIDLKKYALTAN